MARSKRPDESDVSSKEEDVGYAKPPKQHQFKPGQSGNPKGRKKGVKSAATTFRKMIEEQVEFLENGKKRKLRRLDVLLRQLVAKAHKGDPKATAQILSVGRELGVLKPELDAVDPDAHKKLATEDRLILQRLFPDRDFGEEE